MTTGGPSNWMNPKGTATWLRLKTHTASSIISEINLTCPIDLDIFNIQNGVIYLLDRAFNAVPVQLSDV